MVIRNLPFFIVFAKLIKCNILIGILCTHVFSNLNMNIKVINKHKLGTLDNLIIFY